MNWDDIIRKMQAYDAAVKAFAASPLVEAVTRQAKLYEEIARKLDSPLRDFMAQQQAAAESMSKILTPAMAAFDSAWLRQMQDVGSNLDLYSSNADLYAKLEEKLRIYDAATSAASRRRRRPRIRNRPRVAARAAAPLPGEDLTRVLAASAAAVRFSQDDENPVKTRIELLNVQLQILMLILMLIFRSQDEAQSASREAAEDQRAKAQIEAIQESAKTMTGALADVLRETQRDGRFLATVTRIARLRQGPSTKAARLASLSVDQIVTVTRHAGSWLYVEALLAEDRIVAGWIHLSNLRMLLPTR